MSTQVTTPYLSVVAVSRNDEHGGDPLRRTQLFINSLAWQTERYALPTELVLVDWNPPEDKVGLADALQFPVNENFSARVIVVPPAVHAGFRHGDRLPLFQMIGKNVGIRRAHGEFILVTNIDILLDDALFACIAQRGLDPSRMYRADRFDIANALPDEGHEEQQTFCRDQANLIRRNHRMFPDSYHKIQEACGYDFSGLLQADFAQRFPWAEIDTSLTAPCICAVKYVPLDCLHTNGCGDFTLLHRNAWASLHGYGEFEAFSMHIDSIGCMQAQVAGYRETCFLPPLVCYHIEHAPASGWTPESGNTLFERIRKAGIPLFDWGVLRATLISKMESEGFFVLNAPHWGLRNVQLKERVFGAVIQEHAGIEETKPAGFMRLAAIKQQYEHGILFQNFFAKCDVGTDYIYFKRLTTHPFWKFVHIGILVCRGIRKLVRLVCRDHLFTNHSNPRGCMASTNHFAGKSIDDVRAYWNARPCNLRHSPQEVGSREYFDGVERRKYFVEPHIPLFAEFPRWKDKKVLEIGCGLGTDTMNFARAGARVTAVDLSDESLGLARRRAEVYGLTDKITFYQANAEKLSEVVPVQEYDLIYSFGVIHHTPRPELAIEQIKKYMNRETLFKIMVYNRASWKVLWIMMTYGKGQFWKLDEHIARHSEAQTGCPVTYSYTKESIKSLLQGMHVQKAYYEHIFPYAIEAYKQYRYEKVWYFNILPENILRAFERLAGWHLCAEASLAS